MRHLGSAQFFCQSAERVNLRVRCVNFVIGPIGVVHVFTSLQSIRPFHVKTKECRDAKSDSYALFRQDDNGVVMQIGHCMTETAASAKIAELEARGHKQFYWMESELLETDRLEKKSK